MNWALAAAFHKSWLAERTHFFGCHLGLGNHLSVSQTNDIEQLVGQIVEESQKILKTAVF